MSSNETLLKRVDNLRDALRKVESSDCWEEAQGIADNALRIDNEVRWKAEDRDDQKT